MANKIIYTHITLKDWILVNRPRSGSPARFYSYEFLLFNVLGYDEAHAETLSTKDIKEIICGDLGTLSDTLADADIAVQPEAVEGDRNGIRVMSLS